MCDPSSSLNLECTKSIFFKDNVHHVTHHHMPNTLLPSHQNFPWPFTPKRIKTKLHLVAIGIHISSLVKGPSLLQNTPAVQVK